MPVPSITVVTPCFNGAATIEATLRSVREQNYPGLEHLVIDGGSTDGTLDILRAAADVRWISEPDEGLSDAVNKGIAMARGDVIAWLNADDVYLPGALRAVGDAFAAHPEALWVTGRCPIVNEDGEEIRRAVTAYKNALLRRWSLSLYLTQNFVSCPATFVRRDAWPNPPLRQDLRYSMDYDAFLHLARQGAPVVLDRDLAAFRMAEGSLSMSGFEEQFREHAACARAHGAGHPVAVIVNRITSRLIVATYRLLRFARRARRRPAR